MAEISDEIIIEKQESKQIDDVEYVEIKDPYGFIYITTNLVNGKRYLGQKIFDRKWKEYIGSGSAFKFAVTKYGKENFSKNIVCICYSADELNAIEYELSILFDVVESDNWYNLVYGGGTTTGMIVSEETRIKQSESRRKNSIIHPEFDKYHSKKMVEFYEQHPEAKERISDMFKQLWKNPDYIVRMLQLRESYWSDDNNRVQQSKIIKKTWKDPETKNARLKGLKEWSTNPENHNLRSEISKHNWDKPEYKEAQINRNIGSGNPMYGVHRYGINSPRFIPVYCIELNKIYWGAKQAEEELCIKGSDIAQCCKKVRGHNSAGKHPITNEKLHWLYAENAIEQGYITQQDLDNYLNNLQGGNDIDGTMEEERSIC